MTAASGALTDPELARALARAGGDKARRRFRQDLSISAKADPMDLVTDADHAAEAAIVDLLERHRPGDGYLSEEIGEKSGERTWVIDPLDGTVNFARGIPYFCCAVALTAGGATRAAAVYDPVGDELFAADERNPTTLNGRRVRVNAPDLDTAVIATYLDRNHLGKEQSISFHYQLALNTGALRCAGSSSLDLANVAAGRLDGYVQAPRPRWDWEPGAYLVTRAGGIADASSWPTGTWAIAASLPVHERLRRLAAAG